MSGPKVVRIVTREEILAICEGQLARVDAALAEWRRVTERNGCFDEAAFTEAQRRRDILAAHIAADRFLELQKEASLEEAFLRSDIQARLAAAAERATAERSRGRREKEAAQSLAAALERSGQDVDAELMRSLKAGNAEALAAGFAVLNRTTTKDGASRDQAEILGKDIERRDFSTWLATEAALDEDPEIERLDGRISEIAMFAEAPPIADWRLRLEEAARTEGRRRSLLLDALGGEIRLALEKEKEQLRVRGELAGLLAEAGAAGLGTAKWSIDADRLDAVEAAARIADVRAALDAERAERAARDRRAAVLEALAGLGYEVREDMSTTWAANGELVLSNPTRPGYGMEVRGGAQSAERIQMRAVAFEGRDGAPDRGRDRDAESLWCGDIAKLRDRLAEEGDQLAIEKALEIGAVPLKRIRIEADDAAGHGTAMPAPAQRTLPRS